MMLIFTGDPLFSIPSVEAEHMLGFRLSGSHAAVRVDSLVKWNDLNRRRFQRSRFKTRAQLVGDFRNLSQRQPMAGCVLVPTYLLKQKVSGFFASRSGRKIAFTTKELGEGDRILLEL
jgi:hypothetical protein